MNKPSTIVVNGKQAVVLVPELAENLAVVDLAVIKRLAALLPSTNLNHLKQQMIATIEHCDTLTQYVDELAAEVAFHRSVNMITEYKPGVTDAEVEADYRKAVREY